MTLSDQWKFANGWLACARPVPSPNFNARPTETSPELIVIHGISLPPGEYGGPYIEAFFTNQLDLAAHAYFSNIAHLTVSAHFLIRRDGEVVQFVSTDDRAWHAGESCWQQRSNCNDFSIGIEVEGCDEEHYAMPQYHALATLIAALRNQYPAIQHDAIVGHSDIAPARKTDPGPAFDWLQLRQMLGAVKGERG
jgi:N-acetyl-anhydromuramoyl-L-alanine amidase